MKFFERSSTMRHLRESFAGTDRIRDDPFANDRAEMEQYESVVKTVKGTVQEFERALRGLCGMHGEMMGAMKRFNEFNDDISQRRRIDAVARAVESIDEKFAATKDDRDTLIRKLEQLTAMHTSLSLRLVDRDKAHANKVHYEQKLAEMEGKEKDAEKLERNRKKTEEAKAEFEKTEEAVVRECRDALNTRHKDMNQIVGLYVKVLNTFFGGVGSEFDAIKHLPDEMMISLVRVVEEPVKAADTASQKSASLEHVAAAKAAEHAAATDEHNALRSALGLRIQGRAPQTKQDSDNESDLVTPTKPQSGL